MTTTGIAELYTRAAESFIDLARSLSDDEWATHVPCTPLWTVRDVLSHVAGVPDDALAGRMDGAATEPWTASQGERNAALSADELLERWGRQSELFGAASEQMGEGRPPIDCHSHEHDVRHAIGRPGNRDSFVVRRVAADGGIGGRASLPVELTIDYGDGETHVVGSDEVGTATVRLSRFEMFRSRLGRRTAGQVRGYDWSGDDAAIAAVIDGWFVFGPTVDAIAE